VGWVSILSATGFPACSTKSYFFLMGFYPVSNRLSGLFHKELFFFVGLYPVSNRLSGLFHKKLFVLGWIDITNITFFQKGGKCGMM